MCAHSTPHGVNEGPERKKEKTKKHHVEVIHPMACLPQSRDERVFVVLRDRERLSGGTGARTQRLDTTILQSMLWSDELVAHTGCVNRLAWDNDDGTVLASVSDDLKIHLWPFRFDGPDSPAVAGQPFCVETLHTQNIFGVGFLPRSGASLIVTGRCVCSPVSNLARLNLTNRGSVPTTAWMVPSSCIDWSAVLCTILRGIGMDIGMGIGIVCGRVDGNPWTGSGRRRREGCPCRCRSSWARIRRRSRVT